MHRSTQQVNRKMGFAQSRSMEDSNPTAALKCGVLPITPVTHFPKGDLQLSFERITGLEPASPAWKAGAQPLYHIRVWVLRPY